MSKNPVTIEELKLRIKVHQEQVDRLLTTHPIVLEFFTHLNLIQTLARELALLESKPDQGVE